MAVADYLSRKAITNQGDPITLRQVFAAAVQAHEIQGILALSHSFNRIGLDHVLLVRLASTAVTTGLLGGTREEIINALSQAFLDGGALRTYRHAPNTGSRKSWAAGDAASRGVFHAFQAIRGEMGYATALTAKEWGFQRRRLPRAANRARSTARLLRHAERPFQDFVSGRISCSDRGRSRDPTSPDDR